MKTKNLSRIGVSTVFIILCIPYLPACHLLGSWIGAFFKILPIAFLTFFVASGIKTAKDPVSQRLAVLALIFSMAGDFSADMHQLLGGNTLYFQLGLFAVAQFIYAASFSRNRQKTETISRARLVGGTVARILLLLYVVFYGSFCMSHASGLIYYALGIYITLIASMFMTCSLQDRDGYAVFLLGALLFIISDSSIAYGMFVGQYPCRDEVVMTTYYAAQLLLNIMLVKGAGKAEK